MNSLTGETKHFDILCFSHLRWDSDHGRPQHLMTRFAANNRVFYIEEPVCDADTPYFEIGIRQANVRVVVPHIPPGAPYGDPKILRELLDLLVADQKIEACCLWYYTPLALRWTNHLKALSSIYDCVDELSAFDCSSSELLQVEAELLRSAHVVFTAGHSIFEAKKHLHANIHSFPSSIDISHFARARSQGRDPEDQERIPGPRIGYFGVIDERVDLALLENIAAIRPDWNFVMIGPVKQTSHSVLPRPGNVHYLGLKSYDDLPAYVAGWDAAMLPLARNESTHLINPTQTLQYLAAGRAVVSTSVPDVIRPYGTMGLAHIADQPEDFVAALERAITEDPVQRTKQVDAFLTQDNWFRTWRRMAEIIEDSIYASSRSKSPTVTSGTPLTSVAASGRSI